jgi:DNA-binding transcriptional ArsR family regulator
LYKQPIMKRPSADEFQAIADPHRRHILHLLSNDSLTINALAENFDMSRPAVSKHIKILSEAGFIAIERTGREGHCILKQEGFNKLLAWINYFDKFWDKKLRRLEKLMDKKKKGKL